MLVLYRAEQRWEDRMFREFPQFLRPGDCLVLNDSKVFPSRLLGRRAGVHSLPVGRSNPKRWQNLSGEVEVFLHRAGQRGRENLDRAGASGAQDARRRADSRSATRKPRSWPAANTASAPCASITPAICTNCSKKSATCRCRPISNAPTLADDRERYQTVFARETGSVAAPTAGLHFTPEILEACRAAGAEIAYVTLHVGLGTFQPVRGDSLHAERFHVTEENAAAIRQAQRVICAGTTSVRAVESLVPRPDAARPICSSAPAFSFKAPTRC